MRKKNFGNNKKLNMFRIGLDGRMIQGTGIATYIFEFLSFALKDKEFENTFQFVLFTSTDQKTWVEKKFADVIASGRLEVVEANFHWYGFQEQWKFPWLIKKNQLDLMHFPHFNVSVFCPVPYVVTIHDLILLGYPTIRATRLSFLKFYLKKLGYLFVMKTALRRARAIFTFTQFGKNDILKHFQSGVNPRKIHVIPEGPGHSNLPPKGNGDKNLLLSYTIKKPYLLYVGNAYPHKNLDTLVDGFQILLEKGVDWQLVIVGSDDDFREELKKKCFSMGLWKAGGSFNRVVFTGYVKKEVLATLYEFALLYVYPSFYEGFAFPPLEAMSYGVPVVSSNQTVLPEILGDSVEYFNPWNKEEMVQTILKVSNNFERQKELRHKGFQCIQKYSWESLAHKTLEKYYYILTHAKEEIINKNPSD